MRKVLSVIFPIAAGLALVFLALPIYGGDLNILVQRIALDWEVPVFAIQILLSVAAALVLTILFQLLKRLAIWLAVLVVLAALFAPALLSDLPGIADEAKTVVEEKLNL